MMSLSHSRADFAGVVRYISKILLAVLAYWCLHGLALATWLMSYIRSLIYPADVVFAQHHHWPSPFLRHACGQLVIVLFQQLHRGHGTLFCQKSRCRQHYQHLNLTWRHISFVFLFLILSFLCTVTAVLCTIHFKFLIMIIIFLWLWIKAWFCYSLLISDSSDSSVCLTESCLLFKEVSKLTFRLTSGFSFYSASA